MLRQKREMIDICMIILCAVFCDLLFVFHNVYVSRLISVMLPLRKIYIESRHCTADSKSSADFQFELSINITLPPNTFSYTTYITIPSTGTPSNLGDMILYTSELMGLLIVLLNALYLTETTPLRHLSLRCVMLCMRSTHVTHLQGLALKDSYHTQTWLITRYPNIMEHTSSN